MSIKPCMIIVTAIMALEVLGSFGRLDDKVPIFIYTYTRTRFEVPILYTYTNSIGIYIQCPPPRSAKLIYAYSAVSDAPESQEPFIWCIGRRSRQLFIWLKWIGTNISGHMATLSTYLT